MSATDTTAGSSAPSPVPMLNLSTGVPFPAGTTTAQAVAQNTAQGSGQSIAGKLFGAFDPTNALTIVVGLVLAIAALIGSTRGTPIDVVAAAKRIVP